VADEVIRGNHHADGKNVFEWVRIRLNLPGDRNYDPSLPWVSKVKADGRIAADLFTFVDDLRPTGPGRRDCWRAARRAASILNSLGIQDAPQKRRDSSPKPGAWSGSVIVVIPEGVCVLASKDKWQKAKALLQEIQEMLDQDPNAMPRYRLEQIRGFCLEQIRGFLIYVTRTYPCMTPYLIGIHMTIDGWRQNRKEDGWRLSVSEMKFRAKAMEEDGEDFEDDAPAEAPALVRAVPRLQWDIDALASLMSTSEPLVRQIRCKKSLKAYYGFGDASGYAFGGSIQVGEDIWYEYGQWSTDVEEISSNWRELANLVNFIERSLKQHELRARRLGTIYIY
jgi:hypothetical protein